MEATKCAALFGQSNQSPRGVSNGGSQVAQFITYGIRGGGAQLLHLVEVPPRAHHLPRLRPAPQPFPPLDQHLRWQVRGRALRTSMVPALFCMGPDKVPQTCNSAHQNEHVTCQDCRQQLAVCSACDTGCVDGANVRHTFVCSFMSRCVTTAGLFSRAIREYSGPRLATKRSRASTKHLPKDIATLHAVAH